MEFLFWWLDLVGLVVAVAGMRARAGTATVLLP